VMRTMTERLKDKQSLVYQRPPSLEEAPKRESYFDRYDDERPRGPRTASPVAPVQEVAAVDDSSDDEEFVEAEG
jgi:hypothetical protein